MESGRVDCSLGEPLLLCEKTQAEPSAKHAQWAKCCLRGPPASQCTCCLQLGAEHCRDMEKEERTPVLQEGTALDRG